jgi:hypothetical protein
MAYSDFPEKMPLKLEMRSSRNGTLFIKKKSVSNG